MDVVILKTGMIDFSSRLLAAAPAAAVTSSYAPCGAADHGRPQPNRNAICRRLRS
jgi:hypothetical protein